MRILFAHLPLKLLSLALAVLLWFVISAEKSSERGLTVPLELQNFPRDLELTGEMTNTVEVRLRASPGIIHTLGPEDVSARVDLVGAGEGEKIVSLTPENIRAPYGVRVVKVSPSTLTLLFERTERRVVPVRPRVTGTPAAGFQVGETTATPAEVAIAGPKSRVRRVDGAFTEPVSVDGLRTAVTASVGLGLADPMLRLDGPNRARVVVELEELRTRRTLTGLEVQVRGEGFSPRPLRASVAVSGPASVVEALGPEDVIVYGAAPAAGTGSRRVPLGVELRKGEGQVTVVQIDPAEVTLRPAAGKGRP
jgi:YbbR domain-containing protein